MTFPEEDSHLLARRASDQLCNLRERPTRGLTCTEAERRFGIGRVVIANLCRRHPELAVREHSRGQHGWCWILDPPRLGQLLGDALDPAQLARRFDVPEADFASLDPPRRAMLAAVLPLPDRPRQPRPSPRPERVTEVGHEQR
jgi:hypothetical protein